MTEISTVHNYMKEFSFQVQLYLKCRSDNIETILGRNLTVSKAHVFVVILFESLALSFKMSN